MLDESRRISVESLMAKSVPQKDPAGKNTWLKLDETKDQPFVRVTSLLLTRGRYLTPKAKLVFIALRSFKSNSEDFAWPSFKKIEERSNLTKPTVAAALDELERFGWIERLKSKNRGSNRYRFMYPAFCVDSSGSQEVEGADQTFPSQEQATAYAASRKGG